eukprot:9155760-Ditylum_brightwellii.AAC.1
MEMDNLIVLDAKHDLDTMYFHQAGVWIITNKVSLVGNKFHWGTVVGIVGAKNRVGLGDGIVENAAKCPSNDCGEIGLWEAVG